jgi:hypothetical protein
MPIDIERANQARTYIMNRFGPLLDGCTLVLGDQGFRLELALKKDVGPNVSIPKLPEILEDAVTLVVKSSTPAASHIRRPQIYINRGNDHAQSKHNRHGVGAKH